MKPEIITTGDGSHSIYIKELDEHFHSTNGAITESNHVFIQAGLQAIKSKQVNILEMGFGTGLNAFLTLIEILRSDKTIHYTGWELYPLQNTVLDSLNYPMYFPENEGRYFKLLHQVGWGEGADISDQFSIEKVRRDISDLNGRNQFDLVYYDAFAPDKQPELWTRDIFLKVFRSMKSGSILTTYSSKGQVRRNLEEVGFRVEKLPGPPGKRDMTRAWKD